MLSSQFDELPVGELRTAIEELATEVGFPLSQLYVMDGSSRSAHSNAFFVGLPFLSKKIVL
jgi:STE24 endopeptidase